MRYLKVLPAPILETRKALFNCDVQIRLKLSGLDVWSVVHKGRIANDVIFLQVLNEFDDYYDVAIPGEILTGSRVLRTTKTGQSQWCYQIKPSNQSSRK